MARYSRSELAGADLAWIVSLTFGGRAWRFSSRPLSISSSAGQVFSAGGLSPLSIAVESSPEDRQVGERRVSLELQWGFEDAAGFEALVAGPRSVGDFSGEVALIRLGDSWERREVILRGVVVSAQYGAATEPVVLDLAEEVQQDRSLIPPTDAAVTASTWPSVWAEGSGTSFDDAAQGQTYPWVFGAPGLPEAEDELEVLPAWPAPVISASAIAWNNSGSPCYLLVAGHPAGFLQTVESVRLINQSRYDPAASILYYVDDAPLSSAVDRLGRTISRGELQASVPLDPGYLPWEAGQETYAQALAAGGIDGPDGPIVDGLELAAWLLSRSELQLAPGAALPVAGRGYAFDFYVNEPRSASSVALEDVLAWLPVSLLPGPAGWEFVGWDVQAGASTTVATIGPAHGCERTGPVSLSGVDEIVNVVRIQYGQRADSGEFARLLTIGPSREIGTPTPRRVVDPLAEASAARHGVRRGAVVSIGSVWRTSTAAKIGRWILARQAFQRRTVAYSCPQELQVLRPGDSVRLSDAQIGAPDSIAWVTSVSRGPGPCVVALEIFPQLERADG